MAALSRFGRSSAKQHRCCRDGDGTDLSPNGNEMVPTNGEWVAGMYHQAFRFGVADATELRVDPNPLFHLLNFFGAGTAGCVQQTTSFTL